LRLACLLLLAASVFAARAAELSGPDTPAVEVNGITLAYEERGAGPPLLLLHGFGSCGKEWAPFVERLAARHRLIIVDMRGHGRSTNPSAVFTHRQSARDVYALLDALGLERVSAMGISSGGMTLLHMASSEPQRIESMVVIGATTHFPERTRAFLREVSVKTMPPEVRADYESCATRGEPQVEQLVGQFSAFGDSHDDMAFDADALSRIAAHTLVVHGDRDFFFPVAIPVAMYEGIPDAQLWIVPNGDHVPIYDPAVPFVETALRFLEAPQGDSAVP
jgi:pimeloyl-ACP methyl ester carboxylesterase